MEKNCLSCNKRIVNVTGTVVFSCPQCSKYKIVRCKHCRELATPYKCPECGFQGPN